MCNEHKPLEALLVEQERNVKLTAADLENRIKVVYLYGNTQDLRIENAKLTNDNKRLEARFRWVVALLVAMIFAAAANSIALVCLLTLVAAVLAVLWFGVCRHV